MVEARGSAREPPSRGPADAPVVIEEFGDLECPYCRAAAPVLDAVLAAEPELVRLVWRHFPLFMVHPHALTAALAAEAAHTQGRFWELQELLFSHQEDLGDDALRELATEVGLDPDAVVGEAAQHLGGPVEEDYLDGVEREVRGTPTLFVNGERYVGRVTVDGILAAVRAALAESAPSAVSAPPAE